MLPIHVLCALSSPAFGLLASEDGSQEMILHVKLWVETNQIVVDCKVGGTYQVDTRHVISVSDEFQLYQAYTLEFRFVNGSVKVQVVINEHVREKTNN